jgi:hypothetical protein
MQNPCCDQRLRTLIALISLQMIGLLFASSPAVAQQSETSWIVLSAHELDERVQRQVEELAAHDQALAHIYHLSSDAARHPLEPGDLFLELREEKNLEAFLKSLRSEVGVSGQEPTLELAREGYALQASYPFASVPNRIRIIAASPDGFHHALLRIPELLAIRPLNLPADLTPRPQAIRTVRAGREVLDRKSVV